MREMMKDSSILIGSTGLIGSSIREQLEFSCCVNSKNIESAYGKRFNIGVVCAAPGVKWKANANPESDLTSINSLIESLIKIQIDRLVLVSTIDVFEDSFDKNETNAAGSSQAYGAHRLMLEEVVSNLSVANIIRLPAIVSHNLKKNVLYDLKHDNGIDKIHPASKFQFYPLGRLASDIEIVLLNDINLLHASVEPLSVEEIWNSWDNVKKPQLNYSNMTVPVSYRFKSVFDKAFGGSNGYLVSRESSMSACLAYLMDER